MIAGQRVEPLRLDGYVIAVVGGDRREQEIARLAAATGAVVRAYGFPWPERGIAGVEPAPGARSAMEGANFALFPIPGMAEDGSLFAPWAKERIVPDEGLLSALAPGAHIILGRADDRLRAAARARSIGLHEYEGDVALMLMRGPAIVEGLLEVVIENTDITIHGSRVCVVGQGTIGSLVTRTLILLGAQVHVAARNPVQRAAAYAAGAAALPLEGLVELAPALDILISSVPARVVGRPVLEKLPPHALVVDVAAPPGGVDLEAAADLGLRGVWARGLGSRAPVTVGASQWAGIAARIETILGRTRAPA